MTTFTYITTTIIPPIGIISCGIFIVCMTYLLFTEGDDWRSERRIEMKTYIFAYIGISLKEVIHAHNVGEAYTKLYKKGIPFYVIKLEREV